MKFIEFIKPLDQIRLRQAKVEILEQYNRLLNDPSMENSPESISMKDFLVWKVQSIIGIPSELCPGKPLDVYESFLNVIIPHYLRPVPALMREVILTGHNVYAGSVDVRVHLNASGQLVHDYGVGIDTNVATMDGNGLLAPERVYFYIQK